MVVQVQLPKANMGPPIVTKLTSDFVWYCTTKYTCLKIVLKERAEIVVVRRFLTYEYGCGPHCAVRTPLHTTVRVVLKPTT